MSRGTRTARALVVAAAAAALLGVRCGVILGIGDLPVAPDGGATTGAGGGGTTTNTTGGCPAGGCGGSCPVKCTSAACSADAECKSGHCVDGVCCATDCSKTCMACNLPGAEGTCTGVPAGTPDAPGCAADAGQLPVACDDAGACKAGLGATCGANADCSVGFCLFYLCKLDTGSACTSDLQCNTELCSGGTCTQCTQSPNDCHNGVKCVLGGSTYSCLLPKGAYCTTNVPSECDSNNCAGSPPTCQ
jgi:hypothetical protein